MVSGLICAVCLLFVACVGLVLGWDCSKRQREASAADAHYYCMLYRDYSNRFWKCKHNLDQSDKLLTQTNNRNFDLMTKNADLAQKLDQLRKENLELTSEAQDYFKALVEVASVAGQYVCTTAPPVPEFADPDHEDEKVN